MIPSEIQQMRSDRDAMGHMLIDCLENPQAMEIIEREDGYIDAGLGRFYFADFPEWWPHEQEAMNYLVPGRVLDLGCGAGRAGLYLQSRGMQVTGIDNSPGAIQVCLQRGLLDARVLSVTQLGAELGTFANILMLGNNWGLMQSYQRARWLLRRFYHMTTPDARIIASTNDVAATDNPLHLAYQAWNRARGRMSGQLRLRVRYGVSCGSWFDYLIVSKDEMRSILSGTGWEVKCFIDHPSESRYMAVIQKT